MKFVFKKLSTKILKPHQEAAVSFLKQNHGGPLFMEMRLGKTLTAIRFLLREGIKEKILIVSPYSVMDAWENELKDDGLDFSVLRGKREDRLELLETGKPWVVSNFESAERLALHNKMWNAVIIDESIRIANPKAKATKYFNKYFRAVPYKLILCGNPAPENPLQYMTQFCFCKNNFMGYRNYWDFRQKCFDNVGFDWSPKAGLLNQMHDWIRSHAFEMSRKEAGIGGAKIYSVRKIKMNDMQKKQYTSMLNNFAYLEKEVKHSVSQRVSLCYILGGLSCTDDHKIISTEKLKELIYLLRHDLKGQKVLVWCHLREELKNITEYLTEHGVPNYQVHGGMENKEEIRQLFFCGASTANVCCMTSAAAKGGDWSIADTSIFYSNEWSNDLRSQSEDRIFHPEKTTPNLIIDLVHEDTIDEDIAFLLKEKKFSSDSLLGRLSWQIKQRVAA